MKTTALRILAILFILVTVLGALYPASPAVRQSISRDSGVFLYTGWRILQGDVPYRDVWDHKTPGIFYFDALGLRLDPQGLWGVWTLELLFCAATALLLFMLMERVFGLPSALLTSMVWLFTLTHLIAGGNLTEELALPFQAAALWLGAVSLQMPGNRAALFGLGVVTALAFLFRQNAVGISLAAAAAFGLQAWLYKLDWRKMLKAAGLAIAGALVILAPVAVYFAVNGALGDFWSAALVFNFLYVAERGISDRILALWQGFQALSGSGLTLFAAAGWLTTLPAWRKQGIQPPGQMWLLRLLSIALPIEIALVALGGRPRIPYFTSLLPVMAPLAGLLFYYVFERLKKWNSTTIPAAGFAALLVIAIVLQVDPYRAVLAENRTLDTPSQVVTYIDANTSPEDTILIIGAEVGVNFEARRESPTSFVYQYPLFRKEYAEPGYLEEFFEEVIAAQPALIIIAGGDPEVPNRFGGSKTARSEELAFQLNQTYTPVQEFANGWFALAPIQQP